MKTKSSQTITRCSLNTYREYDTTEIMRHCSPRHCHEGKTENILKKRRSNISPTSCYRIRTEFLFSPFYSESVLSQR